MNPILNLTYPLSGIIILTLAIGLGVFLTRKFDLTWRLYWIGAATFILSQAGHIPFNALLTSLFRNGILPVPSESWRLTTQVIILGLSAGLFEETARYAVYRWWARDARSWGKGLLFGAGHGGIEAILVAGLVLLTFVGMFALRGSNLTTIVSPDQVALLQDQLEAYWSVAWYDSLLGAVERAFTLPAHLAMSLLVLQVFTRGQIRWLLASIGWHTLLNAVTLYAAATWGVYIAEALLSLLAIGSLAIVFALRQPEPTAPLESDQLPHPVRESPGKIRPLEETRERLDGTRYTD